MSTHISFLRIFVKCSLQGRSGTVSENISTWYGKRKLNGARKCQKKMLGKPTLNWGQRRLPYHLAPGCVCQKKNRMTMCQTAKCATDFFACHLNIKPGTVITVRIMFIFHRLNIFSSFYSLYRKCSFAYHTSMEILHLGLDYLGRRFVGYKQLIVRTTAN